MTRHSIPSGDVVLSSLPPYSTQPWLNMGIVLHAALLAEAGIRARIVRPLDPPFVVPGPIEHASLVTFIFDPPLSERLEAMVQAYRASPGFFDDIVDTLLAGPEDVIGLSVYRNNVDVSLWIARLIKNKRPSVKIIIGGPEAVEEPAALLLPWIDAVVGRDAECVIVPLVRAFLDGQFDRAAFLPNVWLNVQLVPASNDPGSRPALEPPLLPPIEYAPLMPLFVGDLEPTVPLLLNWGCPYHCTFCSNRGIYGRFSPGSVSRVLGEMDSAVLAWRELHDGAPPGLNLQMSDATTNALPAQFDEFLQGVIARSSRWQVRPHLRGQTLLDTRLTESRARLMAEAGFGGTFFGLDAANDGLRGSVQKPGKMSHVFTAMETYRRAGLRGLNVGVLVGLPGETEVNFTETQSFVEKVLSFGETIESITVLPYVFFLSAQGPEFGRINKGPRRGVLWRADVPGGDPAERARRFMNMFDYIGGRATVCSPVPPYLALPAMLPDEEPARIDAWMARHGRVFDQLTPNQEKRLHVAAPARSREWIRAERVFEGLRASDGWEQEGVEWRGSLAKTELVVLFRRPLHKERVAVIVQRSEPGRRAFTKTRDFDVSYLRQWQGLACTFDERLVTSCARLLRDAEAREHALDADSE
jgi:anaerobic magnesium-protoporphyrin IX monomethyl ester cyclase